MTLKVTNTLSRKCEPFEPLQAGVVKLYTCGPTVYNFAHLGNFRAYVFEDILRRTLEYAGYRVVQVMNLTDVDDKTIRGAITSGVPLDEFTRPFKQAFFEDLKTLRIEPAEHYPAATEHVPDMLRLIEALLAKGHAYVTSDGSVYFRIASFPAYGRLAHLDMEGLKPGARVAHDEYEKDNVADFALWKAWDPDDGDIFWDSPWGRGRPGWHVECSAMSMRYLGESFDIHTGGIDNIFPHHEDEIAQSEAATGQTLSRYWMHCAHLVVDGRKMSKSDGNFHTLRDVRAMGYRGREIRYLLASAQYRQPLNFTFSALQAVRTALERIDTFRERLQDNAGKVRPDSQAGLPSWAREANIRFETAIYDDLNTAAALAALFDTVHHGNRCMDEASLSPSGAASVLGLMERWDKVLAVMEPDQQSSLPEDPEIDGLLEKRRMAREARDFTASDQLRDLLCEKGWVVQDTPEGQKLKPR